MTERQLDRFLREFTPKELAGRDALAHLTGEFDHASYLNSLSRAFDRYNLVRPYSGDDRGILDSREEFEGQSGSFHIKKHGRFLYFPMHSHNYIEMLYVYSGTCRQLVGDEEIVMRAGDVCILDMQTRHQIQMTYEDDIAVVMMMRPEFFRLEFFDALGGNELLADFFLHSLRHRQSESRYIVFRNGGNPDIRHTMNAIMREYFESDICSDEMLSHLLPMLFVQLLRSYRDETGATSQGTLQLRTANRIVSYIKAHCAECSVEDVAREFGYSSGYVRELLRKAVGKGFSDLRQEYRLQSAASMLRSSTLSVAEIAESVGYVNTSHFHRLFRERYSCTPSEYRAGRE